MKLGKRIAWLVVIAALGLLAAMAGILYNAYHVFSIEDKIHDTYFPVVAALYHFEDDHVFPATNLVQLVPAYLPKIPNSPMVDSVEYTVIDSGRDWQLALTSHALSQPRVYCCRSNPIFSAEEEHRVVQRYHGVWTVMRLPSGR